MNLTKEFSVWGFYGNQKPNRGTPSARTTTGIENTTTNVIAMYRDGGFGLSAEWINFKTKTPRRLRVAGDAQPRHRRPGESKSDQYMLTANYFF